MRGGIQNANRIAFGLSLGQRGGKPGRTFDGNVYGKPAIIAPIGPTGGGCLGIKIEQQRSGLACAWETGNDDAIIGFVRSSVYI